MNENYVSAVGWLSLVCSHATARVSDGAFPWVGLRCRNNCVRVRCNRDVQERPCEGAVRPCEGAVRPRQPCASVPPFHFENFRQAWQKCVAKYGNARPRPKQDKYVLGVLVLIDTNPCFTCQLMHIFFSKAQRANHLTPHRLINAASCKPTFSLPHACRGY